MPQVLSELRCVHQPPEGITMCFKHKDSSWRETLAALTLQTTILAILVLVSDSIARFTQ